MCGLSFKTGAAKQPGEPHMTVSNKNLILSSVAISMMVSLHALGTSAVLLNDRALAVLADAVVVGTVKAVGPIQTTRALRT